MAGTTVNRTNRDEGILILRKKMSHKEKEKMKKRMWLVKYYMHGKKRKDHKFMEYNEEKYPRSEMDKAGESSRKDVSASRRYQARGCYKITDEMRGIPAVNMSKRLVSCSCGKKRREHRRGHRIVVSGRRRGACS